MTSLIKVRNLKVHFPVTRGVIFKRVTDVVKAVDIVSFDIMQGETLSLVGESGCGKSTLARAILRLLPLTSGHVFYKDVDLTQVKKEPLRLMRRHMQMIFQDPYASLNPRMTVAQIIGETMAIHNIAQGQRARILITELLETVGMTPATMDRYPHEFSGGQRQRIGIARALAANPDFIVCDEAVASLDVSVQAQIINLLDELQERFGLTYLFIAHDLAVVKHLSHRVAAMYAGKIVELAGRDDLYSEPLHPYTRLLLSAVPVPDPRAHLMRNVTVTDTDIVRHSIPEQGCKFSNRCPLAIEECKRSEPELRPLKTDHWVACHRAISDVPTGT